MDIEVSVSANQRTLKTVCEGINSERAFLFTASTHLSVWVGNCWPSRREPPSGTYLGSFRLLTALEITGFVLARVAQVPIHAVLACVVTTEPGIGLFDGCAYQLVPHF